MKKIVNTCVVVSSVLMAFFQYSFAERWEMDTQSSALLNEINTLHLPGVETQAIEQVRREIETIDDQPAITLKKIENLKIIGPQGEIPLRIYIPKGKGKFPVFVTFHGGGWVFGGLDYHDTFCKVIAERAKMVVVSVDYRLAPKYKFPKPLIDCYAATQWVAAHIEKYQGNPGYLVVGGNNAGGNLAAAVALMARDKGTPKIDYQVLIYPMTNQGFDTPSYQQYGEGFGLTKSALKWFWSLYLNNPQEGKNPYASPLLATNVSHLPPAMILLADFDPLYDDGVQYAEKLQHGGVQVVLKTYPTFHGFVSMPEKLDISNKALDDLATQLRAVAK